VRASLAAFALALFTNVAMAQAGDARRGERVFQYCYSCHSVVPGETGLQGPSLVGIVGRPVAAQQDFEYSPAMRAFAAHEPVWTEELLDRFVAAPAGIVPQTSMEFRGVDDAIERADLLAYLGAAGRP
jgi:cytochrome c